MAKTYNRLEIDMNAKPYDIITAVQADTNSRWLDVSLYENGLPIDLTGHEVKIFMQKPENGGEIWNNGTITDAAAGRCEFLMTTEALAKMGHLQTQISVWKENEEILSTQIFEIFVTKSLLTESAVEASNEYGTLVLLFQNLYESIDLMTEMVENFGAAGETAAAIPAATFWQMLEALYSANREALENASVSEVLQRIGQTSDTGGSTTAGTVMGKLNALQNKSTQVFKSWNRYLYSSASGATSGTVPIQQVDHTRCIVLVERVNNNNDNILYYDYTLTDTSINVVHGGLGITAMLRLAFTVVELY